MEITDVEDTWWMQVLERTGMELCRNASYSGSTVSGPSQDDADGRYACGDRRIADLAGETPFPHPLLLRSPSKIPQTTSQVPASHLQQILCFSFCP